MSDKLQIELHAPTSLNLTLGTSGQAGTRDYNNLKNKPQINGVTLVGNMTTEDLHLSDTAFPTGGKPGDILTKKAGPDSEVEWVTPASSSEADNTRPITAAAVYLEIGNINALLGTI